AVRRLIACQRAGLRLALCGELREAGRDPAHGRSPASEDDGGLRVAAPPGPLRLPDEGEPESVGIPEPERPAGHGAGPAHRNSVVPGLLRGPAEQLGVAE